MSTQRTYHGLISSITRDQCWTGAYVLFIRFEEHSRVCVGRYNGGEPIDLPAGDYLYVGSAMGSGSGLYLPKRLLRHARRSADLADHDIYSMLEDHFVDEGIDRKRLHSTTTKRLRWNVDYLVDHVSARLEAVAYVRSLEQLEFAIVELLESHSALAAPYPGFGAHDHPGHSHLFAASDSFGWSEFTNTLSLQFGRS